LGSSPVALQKLPRYGLVRAGRDWSMVMDQNTGLRELLLADARHTTPSRIKAFRTLARDAREARVPRDGCQMSQSPEDGHWTGQPGRAWSRARLHPTKPRMPVNAHFGPWPLAQLEVVPLEEKRKKERPDA
jgi:hypothetical protein